MPKERNSTLELREVYDALPIPRSSVDDSHEMSLPVGDFELPERSILLAQIERDAAAIQEAARRAMDAR